VDDDELMMRRMGHGIGQALVGRECSVVPAQAWS